MKKALVVILLLALSACQSTPSRISSDDRAVLLRQDRQAEFMRRAPFYETWRHRGVPYGTR